MLEVKDLSAAYGQHPSLNEVSLAIAPGEIVAILGANGAGKSTLLRAIAGICEGKVSGEVRLGADALTGLSPDEIVEKGVVLVPEGRGIFGDLSVKENLLLGAYPARARDSERENLDRVLDLFPTLQERQGQVARTMSGGEQQMLAIGRAMMSAPEILMLDEPSLGLSPLLCKELFQNLAQVKSLGIGVLLVEQNAKQSLAIADRGYLLENTRIVHEDTAARLARDPAVQKAYLGAGGQKVPTSATPAPEPAPMPGKPAIAARPQPQRSADQQAGLSITDLVAKAARQSANAPGKTPADVSAAADRLASDRLTVVTKDIEEAAKAARTRPTHAAKPAPAGTPALHPQRAARPPVIEIYRRPRVEVYRRRPSGEFERE
ncbi:MAG: ATP-binding cassette domain-containing protein [Boseongicola sp. SB0677_bin_26]|nr:ATP-binding cassette domain-containing protein [Boseongicola sp. SB0665_bin_10]MYG26351.1 ATP-binding cassette domain-containing protein [Boseongicola sp. SB0677_bin_26]